MLSLCVYVEAVSLLSSLCAGYWFSPAFQLQWVCLHQLYIQKLPTSAGGRVSAIPRCSKRPLLIQPGCLNTGKNEKQGRMWAVNFRIIWAWHTAIFVITHSAGAGWGRKDLRRLPGPTTAQSRSARAGCSVCLDFQCLKGCRLLGLFGHPVPVSNHLHNKKVFLIFQLNFPYST